MPAAASLSAEVPFWTALCLSETFTGYRKTFRPVTVSFTGKPSSHCLSSCTDLCPWQLENLCTTKQLPEKYWLSLGCVSRRASTVSSWTAALLVTQMLPQKKKSELVSSVVPASCTSGIKPGFCISGCLCPHQLTT